MGMLANRLRKNIKKLAKWAQRNEIECYRLYQQDIPEYPLIVDKYGDCAVVWANERKRDETFEARQTFLADVQAEVQEALQLDAEHLFLKQRHPGGQYRREAERPHYLTVKEDGLRFKVNLSSYHDTGLFLDHRPTRHMVREQAQGKRLLNLFCYTGSFTVYAAAGGAERTTSVDLSGRYLDWLEDNLSLNDIRGEHTLIEDDVMAWLQQARIDNERFDIIVCDPPTFSNSKRTEGLFDVVRDHVRLIEDCMALLAPGGFMVFSNNKRGFALDESISKRFNCQDITERTTDPDFSGRVHHQAWILRRIRTSSMRNS